ncbi:SCP-like protein [Ostertagia ostertagi]
MVYYKSTEFGCHYQTCNLPTMPPMNALACAGNERAALRSLLKRVKWMDATSTVTANNMYLSQNVRHQTLIKDFVIRPTIQPSSCAMGQISTMVLNREFRRDCFFPASTTVTTTSPTTMSTTVPTTTESTTSSTESTTVSSTMASTSTEKGSSTSKAASTASTTTKTASTTTEVTTTTTQTTSTTPPTTTIFDPMTEEIRTNLTNMHNYRRSRLAQGLVPNGPTGKKAPPGANINQLTWSTELEHDAQAYANTCPQSGSDETSRKDQGENFATVSTSSADSYLVAAFRAVQSFWRQIKMYGINEKMLFTATLLNRPLLQFTQVSSKFF